MKRFRKPALAYLVFAISLIMHILVFILYFERHDAGPSLSETDVQVIIPGILLLLSLYVCYHSDDRWIVRILIILRILLIYSICFAFQHWTDIRLLLLISLCIEIGIYEPYPANTRLQFLVLAVSAVILVFAATRKTGWTVEIGLQSILVILIPAVSGLSMSIVTRYREDLLREKRNSLRLNQAVSQLSRSNTILQDAAFKAAEQSRTTERYRVSREIHDTVGYTMTNLIMMMEAATDLVFDNPEELQQIMQAARDQAKSGLEETRRALRELREREEPELRGLRAIQKLLSTFDKLTSVDVEVEYGNVPMQMTEELDSVVFHFVQEGLTNALRHGHASRIQIFFWIDTGVLKIRIRDDGCGSEHIQEGIGLSGMKERVNRYKGNIRAENVIDGFQIIMSIPLKETTDVQNQGAAG